MKTIALFAALTALLLTAGCSTSQQGPTTPKPHPEKYALQVVRIEAPVDEKTNPSIQDEFAADLYTRALRSSPKEPNQKFFGTLRAPVNSETTESLPFTRLDTTEATLFNFHMGPSHKIEDLLNDPNATIIEFPIVYAAVGETAINDQTKTISAPKSYEPKMNANGVVGVVYGDETAKIGQYVEATLQKMENGSVTCDLWFYEKSLAGVQKHQVAPATETQAAVTASLPIFKKNEMRTEVPLAPGTWIGMGGLISTKTEDFSSEKSREVEKTTISMSTWVRILPPKE